MSQRRQESSVASGIAQDRSQTSDAFAAARSLKRQLFEELRSGGQEGDPVRPEDLLPRWPTNPGADPDVASLLFEDFRQRQRGSQDVSLAEYEQRFPEHKDSLANLFRRHSILRSLGAASASAGPLLALPAAGDELFGFRLRQELGRGAFARVFLAEQPDLAGRPVVLKVSGIEGSEPQTLAQLQHTHIVPIYSVHEDSRAGLRAVCMPYFGGASLSRVLEVCWAESRLPTRGEQLVSALKAVQAPCLPGSAASSASSAFSPKTPLARLAGLTYVQAVAWIGALLAEALHHAHQRGVLHRDVKPSNVLLGAEGQPMLLDFNLAQSRHPAQARAHATLGGTVAYMAPEHLRALAGRVFDEDALARQVDQRADIYSLGMVLYELLTGQRPFDQSASYTLLPPQIEAMAVERSRTVPSVRRCRPDLPWGLESIVRKCLTPDPVGRYQQADHLAADLNAFLHDEPLRHAPELSRAERVRKWTRRHPRLTSCAWVAAAAALLLLATGAALVGTRGHLASTQQQLGVAQARERRQAYQAGVVQALCLVNTTADLNDHLAQGLEVCERTLALYGVLDRDDWQDTPEWQLLEPGQRLELAEDTRELLLLLAWARLRTAPEDPGAVKQALALLDRAQAIRDLAPSRALWEDRASYLALLGDPAAADAARARARAIQPRNARDHYLLAGAWVRQAARSNAARAYAKAVTELDKGLHLNRHHYWSWLERGICHQELGQYALAAGDFGVCIGLWPELPWGYFNRGCALHQSGDRTEAIRDWTAALEQDSGFAPAYFNRGLARLELQEYGPALADFDEAARRGQDQAILHASRGVALEGLGRHQEADDAFAAAFQRARTSPAATRNRLLWTYGFAIAGRLPAEARRAFREVLRTDPYHPQALYGQAMLLAAEGQNEEAIRLFDRALEASPGFAEARRFRAILAARGGMLEAARQDIRRCREQEPENGGILYAAACVEALAVHRARRPEETRHLADQALALLRQAFAHGYGQDRAAGDRDLAALHDHPEFQRMTKNFPQRRQDAKEEKQRRG